MDRLDYIFQVLSKVFVVFCILFALFIGIGNLYLRYQNHFDKRIAEVKTVVFKIYS